MWQVHVPLKIIMHSRQLLDNVFDENIVVLKNNYTYKNNFSLMKGYFFYLLRIIFIYFAKNSNKGS